MNKTINIEAITYSLNKLNVNLIEEKSDELLNEYKQYKRAYLNIRMLDEFDKNICIQALNQFKSHLKKHPYLDSDKRDIIIEKLKLVDRELEIITAA